MILWMNPFFQKDDSEGSANQDFEAAEDAMSEEEYSLQIQDPDTGELFDFILADQFEYEDQAYAVLLPDEEDPEEYFIVRIGEDAEDDSFVETLSEEEAEEVYDAYDKILEDFFAEEDFEDEE